MVEVEVIFLAQQLSFYKKIALEDGASVADALTLSGVFECFPEARAYSVGIFSKPASPEALVKSGDRIEIYRPLLQDPKQNRRNRAKSKG